MHQELINRANTAGGMLPHHIVLVKNASSILHIAIEIPSASICLLSAANSSYIEHKSTTFIAKWIVQLLQQRSGLMDPLSCVLKSPSHPHTGPR